MSDSGLRFDAMRTLALHPYGLRHNAYPSVMPALQELGYVQERPVQGQAGQLLWHLTPAGRELVRSLGMREIY